MRAAVGAVIREVLVAVKVDTPELSEQQKRWQRNRDRQLEAAMKTKQRAEAKAKSVQDKADEAKAAPTAAGGGENAGVEPAAENKAEEKKAEQPPPEQLKMKLRQRIQSQVRAAGPTSCRHVQ